MSEPLTTEAILDTAEKVLRRFGTQKATVVDVARELNVSHGTVYRHFSSKEALRRAVAERWLHRVSSPLAEIPHQSSSAAERLHTWFQTLMTIKQTKALEDPELFNVYTELAEEAVDIVQAHVEELVKQIAEIVEYGISLNEFKAGDARGLASAIFVSTAKFHHPFHAKEWETPRINEEFESVWELILSGIAEK
jgi:AcrR family transcriptional regulator